MKIYEMQTSEERISAVEALNDRIFLGLQQLAEEIGLMQLLVMRMSG